MQAWPVMPILNRPVPVLNASGYLTPDELAARYRGKISIRTLAN
jgi:hypothetical protein